MDMEKLAQLLRETIVECEDRMSKCGYYHRLYYFGGVVLAKDLLSLIESGKNGEHGNV